MPALLGLRDDETLGLLDDRVLQRADALDLHTNGIADLSRPSGNGWRTAPIPAGVSVAITSPGSSVYAATCQRR
jgi:hypothetical protein